MKRTLPNTTFGYIFFLLFATVQWANAQSYVPSYSFAASIGTYTPLTTGTILATGAVDDNSYTNRDIGFTFVFDGVSYTKFSVNCNGILAFGTTMTYSFEALSYGGQNNIVVPMNEDLQGHSNGEIRFDTIGTAPFRKLVVQFANWSFYSSSASTDSLNFQIILHESSNIIDFVYGNNVPLGGDDYVEVGIRGSSITEYNNRTTYTDWNTSTAGSSRYDDCILSTTGPIAPMSGLTYRYSPPPKAYNNSSVSMPLFTAVGPGATNEVIARVAVNVTGIGSYLAATQLTVNTTGTTSLSDIAAIKVYYTGNSATFATTTQVGSSVLVPAASNVISDSINLSTGDNYFWVVYDVASGATLGNVVDADVSIIKINGVNQTPSPSAPTGDRSIAAPMTYLSSTAFHPTIQKVGSGTADNEILGVQIITSSVGSSIDATNFDFSALGTTDTIDISNFKLWYTGNSSSFAKTQQVGATLTALPGTLGFSISGLQSLLNDTNYFWLTYDVSASAVLGNFIDAECASVTVDALPQTPTVTAPVGNRQIRANYCVAVTSQYTNTCSNGSYMNAFSTSGATGNITNNASGCPSSTNNYTFFSNQTLVTAQNQTVNVSLGDYTTYMSYSIFIDYDQDGIFSASERVFNSGTNGDVGNATGSFTIPCEALTGLTRMRVRSGAYWWWGTPPADGCVDLGYGETEDYNVVISPTGAVYAASTAAQMGGIVAPGSTERAVLLIPVTATGCGAAVVGNMHFSTAGTTNTADITTAKLYYTGTTPVFNNLDEVGFVSSPNGAFVIPANDTLVMNQTNFYWLTYDISASATVSNVLDAQMDSIEVLGAYHIPTTTAPAGNVEITAPITHVATTVTQNNISNVGRGDVNNEIIGVMVVMSSTGAPVNLTQFDLSALGTTDTAEIRNFSVWYTGSSNEFATDNQFGTSLYELPGTMTYTISGSQALTTDTNYFWVTYDVEPSAVIGNVVDATCSSVTIEGIPQSTVNPAPTGERIVREAYCTPLISNAALSCNWNNYIMTGVSTYGANTNISNYTGCAGTTNNHITYPNITLSTAQNQTVNLEVYVNYGTASAWIDYNQDGIFDNITERVMLPTAMYNNYYYSGSFTVPCDALPGKTIMRVRSGNWYWYSANIEDPCDDYGYGETEDYAVEIMTTPTSFSSVDAIQQNAIAAPGVLDQKILEIPIEVSGCGVSILTDLKLSTAGTTNTADISNAKLYKTGSSATFDISTLVANVAAPNGDFSFSLTDTLLQNVTNYYWLAYDIAAGATLSDSLDARLDSIEVLGDYHIPTNTNPAGYTVVTSPMTYIDAVATQNEASRVGRGSADNQVLGMQVTMSSVGAPVELTQFDLSAAGTTDTANIYNIKVWYTGTDKTFAKNTQFGATLSNLPGTLTFSIPGSIWLQNDTNYFWLTYDVVDTATVGNLIDAEFSSVTVVGVPQIPSVTAPVGAREIREEYCEPLITYASNSCNWGNYYIGEVSTYNANSNITNYTGCAGTTNNYIAYPGTTLVTEQNQTVSIDVYVNYGTATVWIDYNQDGIFDNITERVMTPSATGNNWGYISGSFTVPCEASVGTTWMRVRSGDWYWNGANIDDPCADYGYGETEDYAVTILPNSVVFGHADAAQITGVVAPGTMDQPVLRVPVQSDGCGVSTVTNFYFSTSGSTAAGDIVNAKLYKTGTSTTFNNSELIGTVAAPSGQFIFTVNDTLIPNQENQYWLAYDISASATTTNIIDATVDSIEVLGAYHIPSTTSPSGNMVVTLPMTYLSFTGTQNTLSKVGRNTADNEILGMMVITSSTGAPIAATQFDFTASATDTSNIDNIKLWYTGNSSTFATNTQVGATVAGLPGSLSFSIMANQNLTNDTNYFWLTYDIDAASTIGNLVDASVNSITIDGVPQMPVVSAPTGSREIREDYCTPIASYVNSCSNGYYISAVATTGAVSNLNNFTWCVNGSANYVYYNNQTLVVTQTQTISFQFGDWSSYLTYTAWIDYNQDGVFDNTTERIYFPATTGNTGMVTGTFTVPAGVMTGTTRMRVRGGDYWWFWPSSNITDPCSDIGGGETEDYNVQILPAPPPQTYVWNQTTPGDFANPSNWTPARNVTFGNDKLVFNSGGTVDVFNVSNQSVSKLTVDSATTVNLDAYSAATLGVSDTLELTSGKIVSSSNLTIGVGYDTATVGMILGSGKVEGSVKRWINSTTTSYTFPVSYNNNDNSVNLTYTGAPTANGTITARFISGDPGQTGLPLTDGAVTINKVSAYGVWRLQAGNGYSGGTFTGTFAGEGTPFVNVYSDLRITRRLVNIAAWELDGTAASTTGSNTAPILSRSGMTLLGEFGIGGDLSVNPLPVTLTSFKAASSKGDVLASWTTASEFSNKGFVVERSVDGKNFVEVGFVAGKGNTTKTSSYNLVDAKAFALTGSQKLYYRLRQVDFNGDEHLSQVVIVNNTETTTLASVETYPNPFNQNITVELMSTENTVYTLTVTDLQGKIVGTQQLTATTGINRVELENASSWAAGVYFLNVQGNASQVIKLVKAN